MANGNKNSGTKTGLGSAVRQAGRNVSAKETMQISKQTGASAAQVFAKAQQKGIGIGSAAVNKFNAGKLGPNFSTQVDGPYGISYNPRADAKTSKALGELGAIRNLRMQPGTSYMGYSTTGKDQYNPIVLPKDLLKGMTISGSQSSGASPYSNVEIPWGAKAGESPGPWSSGYKMPDTGITAGASPVEQVAPVEQEQVDPIGMLSGGGAGINSATGLKRKGSSWKNQGKTSKGTSNLNRSLMVSAFNTK